MKKQTMKIEFHVEPADRGVGIMTEGFSAWEIDGRAWCNLEDIVGTDGGRFAWYSNETGDATPKPNNAHIIEACLLAYANAFYEAT